MYSTHNDESRIFINNIPTEEPSIEAIINHLKTFPKYVKEDENMSLKNKCLFGGWILMASKVYRRENLSSRFEDWLYCLCKIKRQTSYNYRNRFKLMSAAPELMNCKINGMYFIKNHEILLNYFNGLDTQTRWKHAFSCMWKIAFHILENQMLYKTLIKAWIFAVKMKMFLFFILIFS